MPISHSIREFRGISPKTTSSLLPPGFAQTAINCNLTSGALRPRRSSRFLANLRRGYGDDAPAGGIVVMPDGRMFGAGSPCRTTGYGGRIFVSDDGDEAPYYLRSADETLTRYPLSMPAAGVSVSASLTDDGISTDTVDVSYAVAIENRDGDEGDLFGAASVTAMKADGAATITISADGDEPDFDRANAWLNIYGTTRTPGSPIVGYFYLGRITWSSAREGATFTDDADTLRQERKVVYSDSTAPPDELGVITSMPGGFLVGTDGDHVWFSDVAAPTRWPVDWRIRPSGGGKITGLGVLVENLYIFVENSPPIIVVAPSPAVNQIFFSTVPWPCIAPDTVLSSGIGLVYAGRSGMVALGGESGQLFTQSVLDEQSFQPYISAASRALQYRDGTILLYGGVKTLLFDPHQHGGMGMTEIDAPIADAKELNGELIYLTAGGDVFEFEGGSEPMTAVWKSATLRVQRPEALESMRVVGDYRPILTHRVFGGIGAAALAKRRIAHGDGAVHPVMLDNDTTVQIIGVDDGREVPLTEMMIISDGDEFTLPKNTPYRDIRISITTKSNINEIQLIPEPVSLGG